MHEKKTAKPANDIHKWFTVKNEELEKEKMTEDVKNKQLSENTDMNSLFALKNGGGSELLISLMDKDNLTKTKGIEAPNKNDSNKKFFDLRVLSLLTR